MYQHVIHYQEHTCCEAKTLCPALYSYDDILMCKMQLVTTTSISSLGGGFKYCLFSPRKLGKISYLTNRLKPLTSSSSNSHDESHIFVVLRAFCPSLSMWYSASGRHSCFLLCPTQTHRGSLVLLNVFVKRKRGPQRYEGNWWRPYKLRFGDPFF